MPKLSLAKIERHLYSAADRLYGSVLDKSLAALADHNDTFEHGLKLKLQAQVAA